MNSAAILLILVATGEAQDPATVALLSALEESVGATLTVRVREVSDLGDAAALRGEHDLNAVGVAVVTWREPAHLGAVVRLHTAHRNAWTNRTIAFSPQDVTSERGRTLGLVVASLWLASAPAAARPPLTPAPAAPPATPPPSSPAPANETAPLTVSKARDDRARPPSVPGRRRFAIGAAGIGAIGAGGPATAVGAAVEGLGFVTQRFALRLGASWRTGPLSELPGSDTVATAGVGCEIEVLGSNETFSLGVRLGALATVHRVRGDPEGGPAETHDRWLPAADLRIQAGVRLGSHVAWIIAAGADAAAGTTDIRKGSDHVVVATIPAVTLVAETGLRLVF